MRVNRLFTQVPLKKIPDVLHDRGFLFEILCSLKIEPDTKLADPPGGIVRCNAGT